MRLRPTIPTDQIKRLLGSGLVAGSLAYLVGYSVVVKWRLSGPASIVSGVTPLLEAVGEAVVPSWQSGGWLFYHAHFVQTHAFGLGIQDFVIAHVEPGDFGTMLPLYLVPPVMLLIAGIGVGAINDVSGSPVNPLLAGFAVALPYALMSVYGAILLRFGPIRGVLVAPDVVSATVLAGFVYPVVFGTVGVALARFLGPIVVGSIGSTIGRRWSE